MNRADSPFLDHWADRDIQILAQNPSGDLDVVVASASAVAADEDLLAEISVVFDQGVGLKFLSDAGDVAVISIFHGGSKIGALCRTDKQSLTDDAIREVISMVIMAAESFSGASSPALDPKETAYLKKVTEGLSDAEIADSLGLSLRAVKERKKRTLVDLNATSIAHAVAIATAAGLI